MNLSRADCINQTQRDAYDLAVATVLAKRAHDLCGMLRDQPAGRSKDGYNADLARMRDLLDTVALDFLSNRGEQP